MNTHVTILRFFTAVVLCLHGNLASGVDASLSPCPASKTVNPLPLRRPPKRILLIPLLSGEPGNNQGGRWSERPAGEIAAFYRRRFGAFVQVMRDIWNWQDFYAQAGQLQQNSQGFDRVIFIGHGGFDGPVLKETVYWQNLDGIGSKGNFLQLSEAQPGLKNVLSIHYDSEQNARFADYLARHLKDLARLNQSQVWSLLKDLEKKLQPLDEACFQHYCAAEQLAMTRKALAQSRIELCERVCRAPLAAIKTSATLAPERFFLFANTLNSLTVNNGLLFFGACNPGSAPPQRRPAWAESELLIKSNLAGGPYNSYVHLMSAVTGRVTAGPIGNSSGDDIVERIMLFENNRKQRYLCVAAPLAD